jgi:hypothetical protein
MTRVSPGLAQNKDGHVEAFVLGHSDISSPPCERRPAVDNPAGPSGPDGTEWNQREWDFQSPPSTDPGK